MRATLIFCRMSHWDAWVRILDTQDEDNLSPYSSKPLPCARAHTKPNNTYVAVHWQPSFNRLKLKTKFPGGPSTLPCLTVPWHATNGWSMTNYHRYWLSCAIYQTVTYDYFISNSTGAISSTSLANQSIASACQDPTWWYNDSEPWWRHQMETFPAFYWLFARGIHPNPPVTGGFSSSRPVTQSFDVFFDLRLNKRLGKQIETPSCSLWRHSYANLWFLCYWRVCLLSTENGFLWADLSTSSWLLQIHWRRMGSKTGATTMRNRL